VLAAPLPAARRGRSPKRLGPAGTGHYGAVEMSAIIDVAGLTKTFRVPIRDPGLAAATKSLFKRRYREVVAVDAIDLVIETGEIVGFLGPNGAGKTTTLKMLSGLLYPSDGRVRVLGHEPSRREPAFLRRMALVMGNRNQLNWDLPAADSFELTRAIYRIGAADFTATRDELVELLDIGGLIDKPVRNLSLGERMKAEIANSLLHRPEVLFLDEPTLGLDVTMQRRIRAFLADYNARHGASIMLTTHYMADVEALAKRVIVIHRGHVLFDGPLAVLAQRFGGHKTVVVTLAEPADLTGYGDVLDVAGERITLRVAADRAPAVTARLLAEHDVVDLTVEDPPIEDVIELAFASAAA
jgi:ABC-2 type transport system ATP-binding protein